MSTFAMAQGGPAVVKTQPSKVLSTATIPKRAEKRFQSLQNFSSAGVRPKPTDIIRLDNGRKVTFAAYLKATDALEKRLNAYGYSLRENIVIPQSREKLKKLQDSQASLDRLRAKSGLSNEVVLVDGLPVDTSDVAFRSSGNASTLDSDGKDVLGVPRAAALSLASGRDHTVQLSDHAGQTWSGGNGDFNTSFGYGMDLSGTLEVSNDRQYSKNLSEFSAKGFVDLGATVFGAELNIFHAEASYSGSDKTKTVSISASADLLGVNLFHDEGTHSLGYAATDGWGRDFDIGSDVSVPLGPFTVSAKGGTRGTVGVQLQFKMYTSRVEGLIRPYITSQVYFSASGGLDIEILGEDILSADVGVDCDLTLLNESLTISANAGVVYDNGFQFKRGIVISNDMDALDGSLSFWASASLLGWNKTVRDNFFQWNGFKQSGDLYNDQIQTPLAWH